MASGLRACGIRRRANALTVPGYADNLSRLRALCAAGLPLPLDLARWTVGIVETNAPAAVLRRRRDELLREAAAQLSGSAVARAAHLAQELARLERTWPAPAARQCADPVRRLLIEARTIAGRPPASHRHLLRVLQAA